MRWRFPHAPAVRLRALMTAAILAALAGGCGVYSPSPQPPSTSAGVSSPSTTASDGAPHSPLTRLTDPNDNAFLAESVTTLLDAQGVGPARFAVPSLEEAQTVTFYVSCAPDSDFRVDAVGKFYAGGCGQDFANFGTFPVDAISAEEPAEARVTIPADVRFHIVAVPDVGDYEK